MTLNRLRAVDQQRELAETEGDGSVVKVERTPIEVDLTASLDAGRMVIHTSAAPHDGDDFVLTEST